MFGAICGQRSTARRSKASRFFGEKLNLIFSAGFRRENNKPWYRGRIRDLCLTLGKNLTFNLFLPIWIKLYCDCLFSFNYIFGTLLFTRSQKLTVNETLLGNTWTWKFFDLYRVSFLVKIQICFFLGFSLRSLQTWVLTSALKQFHDLTRQLLEENWTWTCTSVGYSNCCCFSLSFPLVIISLNNGLSSAWLSSPHFSLHCFENAWSKLLPLSLSFSPSRHSDLSHHK